MPATNKPVTIKVGQSSAYVTGGVWFCSDPELAVMLQKVSDLEEIPGSAPDPDNFLAERVAEVFSGRVVILNDADEDAPDLQYEGGPPVVN